MPAPRTRDACFVLPGHTEEDGVGVALVHEVFIDATVTAFFISLLHWITRFRDVRLGIVPQVSPAAFPRGCILKVLFPNWCDCLDGQPPTRSDWAAHLRTLVALSVVWGVLWGGFTLLVLLMISLIPAGDGPPGHSYCVSPWTYIAVRAAWTDIEVVLVAMGSFVLWSSRAAPRESQPWDERSLRGSADAFSAPRGRLRQPLHREPLTPVSPVSEFVSVN